MHRLLKSAARRLLPVPVYERLRLESWVRRVRSRRNAEPELSLLSHLLKEGDVCADIGAYAGMYSAEMARIVGPTGGVHAFEPHPRYARLLRQVMRRLGFPWVTVHELALGSSDGSALLVERSQDGEPLAGEVHLAAQGEQVADGPGVLIRKLDDVTAQYGIESCLKAVKIDVEGGELAVLRGAQRTLSASRPVVICEIEDRHCARYGHTAEDVLKEFAEAGYVPYEWRPDELILSRIDAGERRNNVVLIHQDDGRPAFLRHLIQSVANTGDG